MQQDVEINPQSLFFVSYIVLDSRAGANPFGHSCLLFSKTDACGRIMVEKNYGYYSQISTTTNPLLKWIKSILGIKYDLQGTHAILREEKLRELIGDGLKGLSFSITQEQYQAFLATMADRSNIQTEQIEALDVELRAKNIEPSGSARYQLQSRKTDIPPTRLLPPFHIQSTWKLNTSASITCKQLALNLLEEQGIIHFTQREKLECQPGFRYAFPRFANLELAPVRLHASGAYAREQSRSGKIFYNPRRENGNQLFWMSAPNLSTEVEEVKKRSALDAKLQPIMQSYHLILKQLYALNTAAAQHAIGHLQASAEALTYLNDKGQDSKLINLQISLANARAVIHPNYYHSSLVKRMMADRYLMVFAFAGLGLIGTSIGLLCSGFLYSGIGLAIAAACVIDLLALVKAGLDFKQSEDQWQFDKRLVNRIAQLFNPLPSSA